METSAEPVFSEAARHRLRNIVHSTEAAGALSAYFRIDGPVKGRSSGAWFERLAGGGDRPESARRIDADDLVAVTMLSVQVPPPVAAELLHGPLGDEVAALLTDVPADVALVDADDRHIGPTSAAA